MTDRRFFGMTGLALLSSALAQLSAPAAVFPALMILVLGFEGIPEKRP